MKSNSAHQKLLKKRPLFFSIGLVIALSLVITAFEWKTIGSGPEVSFDDEPKGLIDPLVIVPTYQPPPPKPKPIVRELLAPAIEKKEIEEAIKEIVPVVSIDVVTEPVSFELPEITEPAVDAAPFVRVEEMPSFVGGEKEFFKYLKENLKFPVNSNNISGKVYVSFVIDEEGNVTEVEVMKGIGKKFDDEALKVVRNSPKWNPGKQRGAPVKVRMVLPITFALTK